MPQDDSNRPPEVAKPGTPSAAASSTPGSDTAFFVSRGQYLMTRPMEELLAICDRLASQAKALGRASMIPELQKIAGATLELIEKFHANQDPHAPTMRVGPLLGSLMAPPAFADLAVPSHLLSARVLVVDDDVKTCEVISLLLQQVGCAAVVANNGEAALQKLDQESFDLVLLDLMLPEMNGYQVLERIKAHPDWQRIPVIVISGLTEMSNVVQSIEMGAEDFQPKPFNPVLLRARIKTCLEKKRLQDQETAFFKELQEEQQKSEWLLLNVLPKPIAQRLKQGEASIAELFPDVTVLFADVAGFTRLCSEMPPRDLVQLLNELFSTFDRLTEVHGVEKIKTIGDAYMVVGGLPTPRPDHASAIACLSLDMLEEVDRFNTTHDRRLSIRVGIHSGPVVAGIIGKNKFAYDLWGDTVNLASRMEAQGQPGSIQVTAATRDRLPPSFRLEERGVIEIKGKGEMTTYLLLGRA